MRDLVKLFPNASRRIKKETPMWVNHGPDNKSFTKKVLRDFGLILLITVLIIGAGLMWIVGQGNAD